MLEDPLRVTPLDPSTPTPSAPVPPAPPIGDNEVEQPEQDPVPPAPPGPFDEPFVPPLPPLAVMARDGELLVRELDPPGVPSVPLEPKAPPDPTVTVKEVVLVTGTPEVATIPPPPPPPPPEALLPPPPPPPPPPTTITSMEVIPLGTVHVVVPVEANRLSHTFVVPVTRLKPVGQVAVAEAAGGAQSCGPIAMAVPSASPIVMKRCITISARTSQGSATFFPLGMRREAGATRRRRLGEIGGLDPRELQGESIVVSLGRWPEEDGVSG